MKNLAALPMRSVDLARELAPITCFLCGSSNLSNSGRCTLCAAPLSPVKEDSQASYPIELIAMFGPPECGKSVYLGMLTDLLSRPQSPLPLLLRGAYSVSLQQSTITALSHCQFPEPSKAAPDSWNWLHGQVHDTELNRPRELLAPDIAGEWLEKQFDQPKHGPTLASLYRRSQGAMVFLDAAKLVAGDRSGEFMIVKALSHLAEYRTASGKSKCAVPLAVVFLQCDEAEACFEQPRQFASQYCPSLVQVCDARIPRWEAFAVSVTPACVYEVSGNSRRRVPLRIEPRGVTEPFVWLVAQMKIQPAERGSGWLGLFRKR